MFILLVTYFSVYLPQTRFGSTVAIQVTALLSSIALYLALPKVDSDQATLSDKMFIMTYAAVAMMIGLTVLKDSAWFKSAPVVRFLLATFQRVAFPAATVIIVAYLISSADRDGGGLGGVDRLNSVCRSRRVAVTGKQLVEVDVLVPVRLRSIERAEKLDEDIDFRWHEFAAWIDRIDRDA